MIEVNSNRRAAALARSTCAAFGLAMLVALSGAAVAQNGPGYYPSNQAAPATPTDRPGALPASNPVCVRLESQLAALNQGVADPGRADQIKRAEDAIAKQQSDLDRTVAQAHKAGCAGEGFLALFSALSPQCGPITSQIQGMRGNLDRAISDLEQLKNGNGGQDAQRRALIGQLAQNSCGPQYASAAASSGPAGFLDALFGGGTVVNPGGDGAPAGTYHTVCVRSCDGYYFPISYSTVQSRFADDERACQRQCPASEVALYSFRNPGESMEQAVSNGGQAYTALPNAFRYRKEVVSGCSCRRPGQSWADALKDADDASTLASGDILVTDQNAKTLSQAPKPTGKQAAAPAVSALISTGTTAATRTAATASTTAASTSDQTKRVVRSVGPPFMASSVQPTNTAAPAH
jgi:hypothetical protein